MTLKASAPEHATERACSSKVEEVPWFCLATFCSYFPLRSGALVLRLINSIDSLSFSKVIRLSPLKSNKDRPQCTSFSVVALRRSTLHRRLVFWILRATSSTKKPSSICFLNTTAHVKVQSYNFLQRSHSLSVSFLNCRASLCFR